MANDWGQGVLNTVGWGLDGTMNGQEVTNLLTEEQFNNWGTDNNVVNKYVAEAIGVTIL